jgi:hypothetical protein
MHFDAGLNLFSYPVSVPQGLTAFGLLQLLGNDSEVSSVLRLDTAGQSYEEAFYGASTPQGLDFSILSGEGYLVNMLTDKDISFNGLPDSPDYDLTAGFNLIGLQFMPGDFSTYDLLQHLGDDTEVSGLQILDPDTGLFMSTGYYSGNPTGPDAPVSAGQGILVYMKQAKLVSGLPMALPTVQITSPMDGADLSQTPVVVTGTVDDLTAVVTVNGQIVSVDGNGDFTVDVPLTEGLNVLTATARSRDNLTDSHTIQVTLAQ